MKALWSSMMLVIGLGALSTGCQEQGDEWDEGLPEAVPARPLSGGGTSGTGTSNHFGPECYEQSLLNINTAFQKSISGDGAHDMSSFMNSFLLTKCGRESFENAVSCALPAGDHVTYEDPATLAMVDIHGTGFVVGGDAWRSGPLDDENTINGVLTCMAARLNPYGQVVPILGLGADVSADGVTEVDDFPYVEMVISAVRDPGSERQVFIDVWPQHDLLEDCGPETEGSLGTRVCDDDPGSCGLELRHDFETACAGSPGDWVCDGRRAVEIRLQTVGAPVLHPGCFK